MGVFDVFNVLAEFLGQYWAGVIILIFLAIFGIFLFYFRLVLPQGTVFEGEGANALAEQQRYQAWRSGLLEKGGKVPALYDGLLSRALDRIDSFFGDRSPAYWTGPSLDKCLWLAVVYPIISLIVIWHVTGVTGPVEQALDLPDDSSAFDRLLSAASLIFLGGLSIWVISPPADHETFRWRVIRFTCFAVAVAVAILVVGVGAGAGATAVAVAIAVAFAGATAGAIAGLVAVIFVGAIAVILAVTVVGVVVAVWLERIRLRAHLIGLLAYIVSYLTAILVLVAVLTARAEMSAKPEWTLLVFLGALPLINALGDWLSLGMTRWLLRRGQAQGAGWPLVYAVFDLVIAACMLVAVMGASLLYLKWMSHLSVSAGGNEVLAVNALINDLRTESSNPALWWIYVTVFTTFIPSFVNLVLGGLAVVRGIPFVHRIALKHFLPDDPARLTIYQRGMASAAMTSQVMLAIIGAGLVGFAALGVTLHGLGFVGLGLLDIADWLA